jgi:hypothetical protein
MRTFPGARELTRNGRNGLGPWAWDSRCSGSTGNRQGFPGSKTRTPPGRKRHPNLGHHPVPSPVTELREPERRTLDLSLRIYGVP